MKILASLLLALAVFASPVAADHGRPFPWSTFSAQAADGRGATMSTCGAQDVLVAQFEKDGVSYLFFYGVVSERFVFAELGPDGKLVRLYFGRALPAPRHDEIVITGHRPATEADVQAGPCPHVAGVTA